MHRRAPERLVGVDVADARDRALVEQSRLDRCPPPGNAAGQDVGGEPGRQRLRAQARGEVRLELAGLERQPRPEAADVAIGDVRPVV